MQEKALAIIDKGTVKGVDGNVQHKTRSGSDLVNLCRINYKVFDMFLDFLPALAVMAQRNKLRH